MLDLPDSVIAMRNQNLIGKPTKVINEIEHLHVMRTAITITQCLYNIDELMNRLVSGLQHLGPQFIIIVRETHTNGGYHFHIHVDWKKRTYVTTNTIKKALQNQMYKRIHMSTCNLEWLTYMFKQFEPYNPEENNEPDKELFKCYGNLQRGEGETIPCTWKTINQYLESGVFNPRKKKFEQIAQQIKEEGITEVMRKNPGFFLQHGSKIEKLQAAYEAEKRRQVLIKDLLPFKRFELTAYMKPTDEKLATYLNWYHENMDKTAYRKTRKIHVWLWGKRNTGKSRFMDMLGKFFPIYHYHIGAQTQWQDHFDREHVRLLRIDEFPGEGKVGLAQLNLMCDGNIEYEQKHKPSVKAMHRITVFIISNQSFDELYQRSKLLYPEIFEACKSRFHHIHVESEITLFKEYWDDVVPELNLDQLDSAHHRDILEWAAEYNLLQDII